MPTVKRRRVVPAGDRTRPQAPAHFPERRAYDLPRPVALFGGSVSERSRQTGAPGRTLYRQAARFDERGVASLCPPAKVEKHRAPPERDRRAMVALRA